MITDEQLIEVFKLTCYPPIDRDATAWWKRQWTGMDSEVGTTQELLDKSRKILDEHQ